MGHLEDPFEERAEDALDGDEDPVAPCREERVFLAELLYRQPPGRVDHLERRAATAAVDKIARRVSIDDGPPRWYPIGTHAP